MGTRQLVLGVNVGQFVFDALIRTNGAAKGFALACVSRRHLQCSVGTTQLLESQQNGRTLAHTVKQPQSGRPRCHSIQCFSRRGQKRQCCKGFGRVQCFQWPAAHARRQVGQHQAGLARRVAGQHHGKGGAATIQNQGGTTGQSLSVKNWQWAQVGQVRDILKRGGQSGHCAFGHARQPALLLRFRSPEQHRLRSQIKRRGQRQRTQLTAHFFGHHTQLHGPQTNAAARLGQHQGGDTQTAQPLPSGFGMGSAFVDDTACHRNGGFFDQELANLVTQHVLVV